MDYGRFKFEALKREKESRREHNVITVKEMKLRPKISEHDFQTKFGYVKHFLEDGDKVKLTIVFRDASWFTRSTDASCSTGWPRSCATWRPSSAMPSSRAGT